MNRYQLTARATLGILLAGPALAGCAEYMDRKDTIAFNAGEAVRTNIVTHVTDPWPVHARNKDIAFSGERLARVTRRYELGSGAAGAGQAPAGGAGAPASPVGQ